MADDLNTQGGNIVSGARATFMFGTDVIGWARNVSMNESIEYTPVEVLNNIEVAHYVPIAYRVSLNASMIRIFNSSFKALGYIPKVGANATEHIKLILAQPDLTLAIVETISGKSMATVTNIRIADNNLTVDARGIMGFDISMVAIRCQDESEA